MKGHSRSNCWVQCGQDPSPCTAPASYGCGNGRQSLSCVWGACTQILLLTAFPVTRRCQRRGSDLWAVLHVVKFIQWWHCQSLNAIVIDKSGTFSPSWLFHACTLMLVIIHVFVSRSEDYISNSVQSSLLVINWLQCAKAVKYIICVIICI